MVHSTFNCKPVGISIDFIYLIKFQGKDVPEKQEIHVSIETDMEHGHHRVKRWFRSGIFMFRILHTERTWAADISGLLKGHATSIIKKPSKLINFIIENDSELITYLSIAVFLIVVACWSSHTISIIDNPIASFSLEKYWVKTFTIFTLLIGVLLSISHFIQYHITLRPSSTILLTEKDSLKETKASSKYLWVWVAYISGLILNVASGVLATYLYEHWK